MWCYLVQVKWSASAAHFPQYDWKSIPEQHCSLLNASGLLDKVRVKKIICSFNKLLCHEDMYTWLHQVANLRQPQGTDSVCNGKCSKEKRSTVYSGLPMW